VTGQPLNDGAIAGHCKKKSLVELTLFSLSFFGTLANICKIIWRHIPGDNCLRGNLKSNTVFRNPTRTPAELEQNPLKAYIHFYNLCTQLSRLIHVCHCSNYRCPTNICSIALSFARHPQPNERQMYYA